MNITFWVIEHASLEMGLDFIGHTKEDVERQLIKFKMDEEPFFDPSNYSEPMEVVIEVNDSVDLIQKIAMSVLSTYGESRPWKEVKNIT